MGLIKKELNEISWPDKKKVIRETIGIMVTSALLGSIIAGVRGLVGLVIEYFM